MKKTISILFIFLSTFYIGISQESDQFEIEWGDKYRTKGRTTLANFLGADDEGYMASSYKGSTITSKSDLVLERIDTDLNLAQAETINRKGPTGRYLSTEKMIHIGDRIYYFGSYYDRRAKRQTLYASVYEASSLSLLEPWSKIMIGVLPGNPKAWSSKFRVKLSTDSSHILVFSFYPYSKKMDSKLKLLVLDLDLEEVWDEKLSFGDDDALFTPTDYKMDAKGNVYILGTLATVVHKKLFYTTDIYARQIRVYQKNGTVEETVDFSYDDKILNSMQLGIASNGELVCAGFYDDIEPGQRKRSSGIKGSYSIRLDGSSFKVTHEEFEEFDLKFVTQNWSTGEQKRAERVTKRGGEVQLFSYALDDLIMRDDGGVVLVGEQFYIRKSTTTTDGVSRTTYYYYYNDIIVVSINPAGEIEWSKKIAKRQMSANDGGFFSSYALTVNDNKLHFLFNDNVKNLEYKGHGKVYPYKVRKGSSIVALVTVNSAGEVSDRESIFSQKEVEVVIRPKVCRQMSDNTMLIYGMKRRKQRIAKLTFK
jgi:hypothetical protein